MSFMVVWQNKKEKLSLSIVFIENVLKTLSCQLICEYSFSKEKESSILRHNDELSSSLL